MIKCYFIRLNCKGKISGNPNRGFHKTFKTIEECVKFSANCKNACMVGSSMGVEERIIRQRKLYSMLIHNSKLLNDLLS